MKNADPYHLLKQWFKQNSRVAVAFSGGVDSTLLLEIANKVLPGNLLALTLKTAYIPEWEINQAIDFCRSNKIPQIIVHSEILPEITNNPENRCYLCKQHIFTLLKEEAISRGFPIVVDGTNTDDTGVYRPGLAALAELGIKSPFLELGITKSDIRTLSMHLGLATAEKHSNSCLLTRFPYNFEITVDALIRIDHAERYLSSLGFDGCRVRNHGNIARIEIDKKRLAEFVISEENGKLAGYFHKLGFEFITVDLEGYRSGSYDTILNQQNYE
jgi:pyridinium-3,5-biscarboxylic acid mononucleotide sulfurtransferase